MTVPRVLQGILGVFYRTHAPRNLTSRTNIQLFAGSIRLPLQKDKSNMLIAGMWIYCVGAVLTWKGKKGVSTKFVLIVCETVISLSANPSKICDLPVRNFLFKEAAIQTKFGIKRWNKLHRPKDIGAPHGRRIFVPSFGVRCACWKVVAPKTNNMAGMINSSCEEFAFLQLECHTASCNNVNTCRVWPMFSSGVRRSTTMSFKSTTA